MARIGLLALARATFDVPYAQERLEALRAGILAAGHEIIGGEGLLFDADATSAALEALKGQKLDLLLIAQITFTDATMTVRIAQAGLAPLALWAIPEPRTGGRLRLNSFCGVNLAAHALRLGGHAYSFFHAAPETSDVGAIVSDLIAGRHLARPKAAAAPMKDPAADEAARSALAAVSGARIGRIGERPDGFFTCDYDGETLERLAGVSVKPITLDAFFEEANSAGEPAVTAAHQEAAATLSDLGTVDQGQLEKSLRLRAALGKLREEGRYDAFAVRCWPEMFTVHGGAVCGPVGMMGERRVPCACEADVHGALTNLFLQEIAGEPAFLVDLVDIDHADGTGVVWHCGQAPVSMRDGEVEPHAAIHSNRKMPLLFEFPLKPGRVTLARLSQAGGEIAMVICGAEMVRRPLAFSGTAGVVRFDAGTQAAETAVLGNGLEHHLSLVYGDHRATLRALAARMKIPVLEI